MTIQEAIDRARRMQDTEIPDEEMVIWLSTHDANLYDRVLAMYGAPKPEQLPYDKYIQAHEEEHITPQDVELMLPDKYAQGLYPAYLVMMIDLRHGDIDRYNNDAILYNKLDVEMRKDISREGRWRPPRSDCQPWRHGPCDGRTDLRF